MNKTFITIPSKKLIGIQVRTNNEWELSSSQSRIQECITAYWENLVPQKIKNKLQPDTTLCVYTDYESDFTGQYTFFMGQEVSTFEKLEEGLKTHEIPAQKYVKFTVGPGAMPNIVIDAWKSIWKMSEEELGGKRSYLSDFELYDKRAADIEAAVVEIYIGID